MTYRHKEAFCLMWYACKCGHRERIWNSRDGVTPFGTSCPSCGDHSLYHVDWGRDAPAPAHQLSLGQRFFRDGTPEEAIAIIERRIVNSERSGHPVPDDIAASLRESARLLKEEWRQGWPKLDRYEGVP